MERAGGTFVVTENDKRPTELRVEADSETRFRDYADADADWFWELDPNLRFAIVSKRQEGRSVVHEQDLLGKTPWEFADADPKRDSMWAAFVDKLERRETFRGFRIALRQDDGGFVYWRMSGKPVLALDRTFLGYRGITTDETVDAIHRVHLQAQSNDYQITLDMLGEGVAYFDGRERLTFANATFRKLIPLMQTSFATGTSFERIITGIQPMIIEDRRKKGAASVVPTGCAFHWRFIDGRQIDGEISPLPSGGLAIIVRDHTPRPENTASQQDHFQFIADSPQAFFVQRDGQVIYVNRAAADIFGYSTEEILGRELWKLFDPDEVARIKEYAHARKAGADVTNQYTLNGLRSDGSRLHLEVFVSTGVWDGDDAIQVFLQDRTKEHIAEIARSDSEARFRNLVEGSIQGYFVHRDWKILYANAAAAKVFGYTVEEFVGLSFLELVSPEERNLATDIRRRYLAGDVDVPERYELNCIRQDGEPVSIETNGRIVDWDGEPAFQATMIDVSRRKKIESYLVRAKEDAERADRSKTEFLGNMSHELRTPLNAIIGFSQLIKDQIIGSADPHYIDYANAIHSSGMHLLELVNDLLDVSSIESGALMLNDDDVDLVELAKTCERMLRPRAQKAELLVSVDTSGGPLHIRGDDRRLKQILINLANNSIKFTKPGGHVIMRAYQDQEGRAVIEVEDDGIGISAEDQKTVFDPFIRVDSAFVSEKEGTGLGLPLVHALAELHNATVKLESEAGVGTKIAVIFPKERTLEQTG